MRFVVTLLVLAFTVHFACRGEVSTNVNAKYTVESVEVIPSAGLSSMLRKDIQSMVGGRLDPALLNEISRRIRREAGARMVIHRITRGTQPYHVRVIFEIIRKKDFELAVPKLAYHSKQGWSGAVDLTVRAGNNTMSVGAVNDNDEFVERLTGWRARYERTNFPNDRTSFRVDFESYHQQWTAATLGAFGEIPAGNSQVSGIYRWRNHLQPSVSIRLSRPLTLTSGVSLQHFQAQFPAARTESSHALVNTLRYQETWEGSDTSQSLDAGYSLHAASPAFGGNFGYTRHSITANYELRRGRSALQANALAGSLSGRAPLYERFVLGNSSTLRGWNKYDIQPHGGSRVAYASVEYRYRMFHAFYDAGALWNRGEEGDVKQALGCGVHAGALYFSIAFPLRDGRMTPVFLMAMNY